MRTKLSDVKHLWDVKHSYYCNEEQYTSSQHNFKTVFDFESFAEFLAEWGDADLDWNMVFRWDWEEGEAPEEGEEEDTDSVLKPFSGDIHERNGQLKVFFMMQRKGYHSCCIIRVCRADEPAVLEFLKPRMEYMLSMWAPLAPVIAD
jgi:hypothetical protein